MRCEAVHVPFTVLALPLLVAGAYSLAISAKIGYQWKQQLSDDYSFHLSRFTTFDSYIRSLPLDGESFQRIFTWILELGIGFSLFLGAMKLDGGDIGWGWVLFPLSVAEFVTFGICMSQCLIKECVFPRYVTVIPYGFNTWITWLVPPFVTFQFLLMVQLNHIDHDGTAAMSWSLILAPLVIVLILQLLGQTMCVSCCAERELEIGAYGESENEERNLRASDEMIQDDMSPRDHEANFEMTMM